MIIIAMIWLLLFIVFRFRILGIGIFSGNLQYGGFLLIIVGIVLREWSIWVLGKHFTVQVQIREKAKLVKHGPYKYIRHPSYTGGILSLIGITLSIGTWFRALVAFVISLIGYQYRISIEEKVLQAAFGTEYEEYKNGTWKLFPGF
ncbi:methyltransferase family protein [uncultured Methanomethylovorans sp.]|uniref:methyltransferase family protein n=1 Tax=uncultured Methanomethylovorans sp. TaxID=183759 RepID=UPI0037479EA8